MREITENEMEQIAGGMSDFTAGGMTVIGLGFAGGLATAPFGLAIGGAMMLVGYYQD